MKEKNRLKKIIKDRGIKQKWLAEKSNVNESTLSGIINEKNIPSVYIAIRIAKALDMYVEEIFYEDDNNNNPMVIDINI